MRFQIQILLVVILSFSAFAKAEEPVAKPPLQSIKKVDPEQFRWLYELLIPSVNRDAQPAEAFKSFRVHLEDTNSYFPVPSQLKSENFNLKESVQGKITYVSFVPKRYQYDVIYSPNSTDVVIRVKLHFKNPQGSDIENFKRKLSEAETIWNSNQTTFDFKYQFQFQIVEQAEQAHFSVQILDSTRGPYDTNWGRSWNSIAVAHEIGHMLGLGDEYQTLSSVSDCLSESIMCESNRALPMAHHYYFILRRLMK